MPSADNRPSKPLAGNQEHGSSRPFLFRAIVENKLHVGLFALAALWAWSQAVKAPILSADFLVVPLIAVAIYQWNRLTDRVEDAVNCPDELARALRHANAIRASCLASVVVGLTLASVTGHRAAALLAVGCVVLGLAYGSPMPFCRRRGRLKARFLLKNLSGAVGWSVLTILYPSAHAGLTMSAPLALAAIVMFLGVWGVELLWDLRDVVGDRLAEVNSLPVLLGPARARNIGYALSAVGLCLIVAMVAGGAVSRLWLVVGLNPLAICCWLRWCDVQTPRGWSHVLVVLEATLLVVMGLLPW
jgi:4-hydroxybenzoate polyprenyltransferase